MQRQQRAARTAAVPRTVAAPAPTAACPTRRRVGNPTNEAPASLPAAAAAALKRRREQQPAAAPPAERAEPEEQPAFGTARRSLDERMTAAGLGAVSELSDEIQPAQPSPSVGLRTTRVVLSTALSSLNAARCSAAEWHTYPRGTCTLPRRISPVASERASDGRWLELSKSA